MAQPTPAIAPTSNDGIGCRYPAHGVMATIPATAPDAAPRVVGKRSFTRSKMAQPSRPAAAANWVLTKACTATSFAPRAEPALNPNHPNHSSPAPSRLRGTEWGAICSPGHPRRRPSTSTMARVEKPELISTTVPPAKSSTPRRASQPSGLNTQWANGTYTTNSHTTTKTTNPLNRMRSTVPPLMSAAVITANIIWNTMTADGDTTSPWKPGSPRCMPPSPANPSPPITPPPASAPKDRLKPRTAHSTVPSPMQTKLCIMTARTFLARTIPP